MQLEGLVGATRLEEQHRDGRILRESCGQGSAGRACADDDVVGAQVARRPRPAVVVTVTDGEGDLLGSAGGSVKVTPLGEYPAKGRGTGGVRAHRLLKGETSLVLGWVGAGPALAASKAGVARALPVEYGRRDGSGVPVDQRIEAVGAGASPELLSAPPVADDPVTVSAD